jgi:hypothetical protein
MNLTRIRGVALIATSAVGNSPEHRVLAVHTRSFCRPLVQVSKEIVSSIGQWPKSPATRILTGTLILTRLPATSWYVSWYPVSPPKATPRPSSAQHLEVDCHNARGASSHRYIDQMVGDRPCRRFLSGPLWPTMYGD